MFRRFATRNRRARRINRRLIGPFAIFTLIMSIVGIAPVTAHEQTANNAVIIRTHKHMSIPDHVFMSKAERCHIPSKKKLAELTDTRVEQWYKYPFETRMVEYYGDGHTVVRIDPQKDQNLGVGYGRQKMKYYSFGETYVGTGDFTFSCNNSKHRLFNPNVTRLFCKNGSTRLQNLTDRRWHTVYEDDPNDYPTSYYVYKMHKYLDGFFVPRDANFIVEDSEIRRGKTFQTGYLTPSIPHRDRIGALFVRVETYC